VPESSRGHLPRLNDEVVLRGLHEDVLADRLEVVAQAIERHEVRIAGTVAVGPVRVGRIVAAAASAAAASSTWIRWRLRVVRLLAKVVQRQARDEHLCRLTAALEP